VNRFLFFLLPAALLLHACAARTAEGTESIEIRDAWSRPASQGDNGAVYFVIENHTFDRHEMTGAASDVAQAVEIHESRMDGDVMQMHHMSSVSLEPGAEVTFEPGGLHIMLIGLQQDLKEGEHFEVTLQFRDFEDIRLQVPVQSTPADEHLH
jgi:copper(I)-binding protein